MQGRTWSSYSPKMYVSRLDISTELSTGVYPVANITFLLGSIQNRSVFSHLNPLLEDCSEKMVLHSLQLGRTKNLRLS